MKISIVTVTYNASTTLEATMLSVFNQTYSCVEYIIIDGGSTDDTINIIGKYADKLSYWVSEPDKGIYDAMNKALKIVTGDFLIFMGADDLFYNNDVIQNVVSQISDIDAVYYGSVLFKGIGTKHLGKFNKINGLPLIFRIRPFFILGLFIQLILITHNIKYMQIMLII